MLSFPHLLLVLIIVVLLFGAGKLPKVMGDIGKGIKNLREELGHDEKKDAPIPPAQPMAPKQEVLPPDDKTINH